jgi:signal transduction histidine kinase
VEIELQCEDDHLRLRLADDGRGFDVQAETEGHGLPSIRRRAASIGALMEWQSAAGQGTMLRMKVRLEPSGTLSLLRGGNAGGFR